MSTWKIYRTVSGAAQEIAECVSLEFHDIWMGEEFVTVSIVSPTPIELQVGDYLTYRGAAYSIYSLPAALKQARSSSYGEAFKYDNVKLSARSTELTDIRFLDIVLGDNNLHYTSLPTFSVYCETVDDLVDRLQANTDRNGIQWFFITPSYSRTMQRYTGAAAVTAEALWHQYYDNADNPSQGNTEINISVDKMSVWDGLAFIKNNFGLNFITRDRSCIIGAPGVIADHIFRYGKGNGLYEIERTADTDQQIVTKLFAYGSDKNLPLRYYATIGDDMPNNMAVNVLMLPGFPQYSLSQLCRLTYYTDGTGSRHTKVQIRKTPSASYSDIMDILGEYTIGFSDNKLRPYITSGNVSTLGVKEGDIHFTEENDDNGLQEVYPSIEGMTAGDAGVSGLPANERLDEIVSISNLDGTKAYIDDNGVFEEGAEIPNFYIYLKPLGFNLKEAYDANGGTMVIHLNDGYCGGREFAVKDVIANGTGWKLNVERSHDESLDLYFPYSWAAATGGTPSANEAYQIRTGDHFVLTEIEISDTSYIWAASVKALRKAITWLLNNDYTRFTYLPKVDEIFMARQHDSSTPGSSLHDTLKAGDVMSFQDDDLNIVGDVFIDSLTIKENGNNGIPTYDVVLRNDKQVGKMQRIQNQLNTLSSFIAGGGGGLTTQQIRQLIQAYGSDLFLSKLNDDTAQGFLELIKGIQVGVDYIPDILGHGGIFSIDQQTGKVSLVTDYLYARVKAYFDSVVIREYLHESGNRIKSPAQGFNASRVEYIKIVNSQETIVENASDADFFRCYWRVDDGETKTDNQFIIGDLAFCEHSGIVGGTLTTKRYWRVVIGRNSGNTTTANGEAWIDLSNAHGANNAPVMTTITYEGQGGSTLTKSVLSFENASNDVPEAHDDICMLGCVVDTTRQGAIVEYVSGTDSPSYQIFQGIGSDATNPYSLDGKNQISLGYRTTGTGAGRAYMNVYGDMYIGAKPDPQTGISPTYIEYKQSGTGGNPELNIKAIINATSPIRDGNTTYNDMQSYIEAHSSDWTQQQIDALIHNVTDPIQQQIDGAIDTWFYDYMPVHKDASGAPDSTVPLNVEPYKTWNDADIDAGNDKEKRKHLGDVFYDNKSGYAFRFANTEPDPERTPVFAWTVITDSAVVKALADAAKAQDTADHKRRIFVLPITIDSTTYNYPYPPYDVGDLWVNAKYPYDTGATYNNEILKCITAKDESGSFAIADWDKASKYTDDSQVEYYMGILAGSQQATSQQKADALATERAIRNALGGATIIAGGLMLTSIIGLRQFVGTTGQEDDPTKYTTWAGISGEYDDWSVTHALGHGIAAWYGGDMIDKESLSASEINAGWGSNDGQQRWARSIDRFDGSGYRADGSLSWDATGTLTLKNVTWGDSDIRNFFNSFAVGVVNDKLRITPKGDFTTLNVLGSLVIGGSLTYDEQTHIATITGGSAVATQDWVNTNYVTKSFFAELFTALQSDGLTPVNINDANAHSLISSIRANVGFWTQQYISSLGQNSGSGGGGGATMLSALTDVDFQTTAPLVNGQVLKYDATRQVWYNATDSGISSVAWSDITGKPTTIAGYNISDAYISNGTVYLGGSSITPLTSFTETDPTVPSWAKAANKPSYTLDEVSDGTTRKLANYLPLSGGTMSNTTVVTNLNADLLDGQNGSYYAAASDVTTLQGYFTNGSANTAVKLQTSRTIWGQSFDGSSNVDGRVFFNTYSSISRGTLISPSNNEHDVAIYCYNGTNNTSLKVYATTASFSGSLTLTTTKKIYFGDSSHYIELDANGYFHFSHGLYSDAFVSAYGANAGGGGGGGATALTGLSDVAISNPTNGQVLKYNSTTGKWYNGTDSGVSSVAWGDITGKPSTLAGYNIGDAYISSGTVYLGGSSLSPLLLSGGTLTDALIIHATQNNEFNEGIRIQDAPNSWAGITFGAKGSKGITPETGQVAWFAAKNGNGQFIIAPDSSVSTTGLWLVKDGDLKWRNNTVYHSGNLPAYPTKASWNYDDVYLKLTGGTLTGTNYILTFKSTNENSYIYFRNTVSGTEAVKAAVGYWSGIAFLSNESGNKARLAITDDGTPQYWSTTSSSSAQTLIHTGNIGSQSVSNADKVDNLHASSFLRSDANQTTSCQYTFSKVDDHAIKVGTIRGLAVGSQTGEFIHLYERVSVGSPSGWGALGAPTYGFSTYGGAWLATNTGSVGIATTSPETKLDVNGIQQIYQRGLDNTAFKNLLLLKAQNNTEPSGDAWADTYPTFGIGFRRYWTSSGNPYGETTCAGIYATVSGSWRGGLVFRTKNNQTQGGTHDVTALRLAPSGAATFASTVTATSFAAHTGTSNWSYMSYKSGTYEWYVGTIDSTSAYIGQAGAFEIRSVGDSYSGISIRRGTSAYGRLVVTSTTAECSIGLRRSNTTGNPQWVFGIISANDRFGFWNTASAKFVANFSPNGSLYLGDGDTAASSKLHVNGETRANNLLVGSGDNGRQIDTYTSGSALLLQQTSTGNVVMCRGGGYVGINESAPDYELDVDGDIYASGAISCLSDERFKTIKGDTTLTVDQIAKMPSIKYTWNDGREDKDVHVGSIAQRWMEVLPEVVLKANDEVGTLSINYGVAAMIASITTARKVVDHERRIKELEKENMRLRTEIQQLTTKGA